MNLDTNKGKQAMIMGCPMGAADFSATDFIAVHPETGLSGVLFGIDPADVVTLTVVNEYDQQVEHTFQPGPQPYLLKKIIKNSTVVTTVNYFI
jgi:hypothetical protein